MRWLLAVRGGALKKEGPGWLGGDKEVLFMLRC